MNWYSSVGRFLKSQERIHMQRVYTHANQRRTGWGREYEITDEDLLEYIWALHVVYETAGYDSSAIAAGYVDHLPKKLRGKVEDGRTAARSGRVLPEQVQAIYWFEFPEHRPG